jgi:hypothetical protein
LASSRSTWLRLNCSLHERSKSLRLWSADLGLKQWLRTRCRPQQRERHLAAGCSALTLPLFVHAQVIHQLSNHCIPRLQRCWQMSVAVLAHERPSALPRQKLLRLNSLSQRCRYCFYLGKPKYPKSSPGAGHSKLQSQHRQSDASNARSWCAPVEDNEIRCRLQTSATHMPLHAASPSKRSSGPRPRPPEILPPQPSSPDQARKAPKTTEYGPWYRCERSPSPSLVLDPLVKGGEILADSGTGTGTPANVASVGSDTCRGRPPTRSP